MIKVLNNNEFNEFLKKVWCYELNMVKLNLGNRSIRQWIREKKFVFIKKELQIYNNISFACRKNETGCQYYFFTPSIETKNRLSNMLNNLIDDVYIPIYRCNPNELNTKYEEPTPNIGEYNVCPLF